MNRIDVTLAECKQAGKKALFSVLTAGDPDLQTTEQLVLAAQRAGADLIGLGVPFSDPTAESPVLQRASLRSLQAGTTLDAIFELAGRLRRQTDVPLLFIIYANMIFHRGPAKFFSACRQYGVDGVLVPDLPFEERDEFEPYAGAEGVYCIRMVAPAGKERISTVVRGAKGFVYCAVAPGGELGEGGVPHSISSFASAVQKAAGIPVLSEVHFDGQKPESIRCVGDGVAVADEIVEKISELGYESAAEVGKMITELKVAMR